VEVVLGTADVVRAPVALATRAAVS
jgi:hypothetical protein